MFGIASRSFRDVGKPMKYDPINPAAPILDQSVASDCGELAVGCSDAAGRIKLATDQMDRHIGELGRLERSAERRVGTEGGRQCRFRGGPYHYKKKKKQKHKT